VPLCCTDSRGALQRSTNQTAMVELSSGESAMAVYRKYPRVGASAEINAKGSSQCLVRQPLT
jgi:hypothetical protein